ncbi:hypothetical protein ACOME3_004654 [Neoechinorhynchus agilis]
MSSGDEDVRTRMKTIEDILINQQLLIHLLIREAKPKSCNMNDKNITIFRAFLPTNEEWASYEMQLEKHFEYCGCILNDPQTVWVVKKPSECTYSELLGVLRNVFRSEIHEIAARYKFFNMDLERRAYREWEKMANELEATEVIRPMTRSGERLFIKKDLSLKDLLEITDAYESANEALKIMPKIERKDQSDPEVLKVSTWRHKGRQMERRNSDEQDLSCRAKTMMCYKCNRVDHLLRCCKTSRMVQQIIRQDSSDDEANIRCIRTVKGRIKAEIHAKINGILISMEFDAGVAESIITRNI